MSVPHVLYERGPKRECIFSRNADCFR
jgi:hypothetical protein